MKFVGFLPWDFSNTHHGLTTFLTSNRVFGSLTLSENQMCLRYLTVGILWRKQKLLNVLEKTLSSCCPAGATAAFQWLRSKSHSLNGSPCYCRYWTATWVFSPHWWLLCCFRCATLEQILLVTGVEAVSHCTRFCLTLWTPFCLFLVPMIWIWR